MSKNKIAVILVRNSFPFWTYFVNIEDKIKYTYTWAFRRTQLQEDSNILGCSWMENNNQENHGVVCTELHPYSPHQQDFHQNKTPRRCPICFYLLAWYAPEDPMASQTANVWYRYKISVPIQKSEISLKYNFKSLFIRDNVFENCFSQSLLKIINLSLKLINFLWETLKDNLLNF